MTDASILSRPFNGWNTWSTYSLTSHVSAPDGRCVTLGLKEYRRGAYKADFFPGGERGDDLWVRPGLRTFDGSYTSLNVGLNGSELTIETSEADGEFVAVVTPLVDQPIAPTLVIEAGLLWNRPGCVGREGQAVFWSVDGEKTYLHTTGAMIDERNIPITFPALTVTLTEAVGVSVGAERTLDECEAIVAAARAAAADVNGPDEASRRSLEAMVSCLAWNTVYDAEKDRIISPCGRGWSCGRGGWVLFCWDTFFAAAMAGLTHRDIAYANVRAMLDEATEEGFVPNVAQAAGRPNFETKSRDRSQPPVGALVVWLLFQRYDDKKFLRWVFPLLLRWNRWWAANRDIDGYLCWGSSPFRFTHDLGEGGKQINTRFGAALESGLDNSPMYDDVPFDARRHCMLLADVGLMGLYVADCRVLRQCARLLGHADEAAELDERVKRYTERLQSLWDEETGLFLNKRLDTGELCGRLSPVHFYPLIGNVATDQQARRMIDEHLLNPDEFWGEWVLPSIARDDPAFGENYWRGRIWAPMNFLVYLGLANYACGQEARGSLARKSRDLLAREWNSRGHVHENYSAVTGEGCGVRDSDPFHHWGGLLALIGVFESGQWPVALP